MGKTRYIEKERNTRGIIGVFVGIIVFLTIFSPFYLLTIQYYVGSVIREIFEWIGNLSLMGGGVLLIFSVINAFFGKVINVKWFATAIALLWIGSWCTGIFIEIMGIPIGNTQGSGGTGFH